MQLVAALSMAVTLLLTWQARKALAARMAAA
jgi:hypothetical protein